MFDGLVYEKIFLLPRKKIRCLGKRTIWHLLNLLGAKQAVWDDQFRSGLWQKKRRCNPNTVERVTSLCKGGILVEFGCGIGSLPCSLPKQAFSRYIGYDISNVAINKAKERVRKEGLNGCEFFQCDMADWQGTSCTSLIVLEESLYYLSKKKQESFLKICCNSLAPEGKILVIVYSTRKQYRTLDTCRRICKVISEEQIGARTYLTLTRKEA